MEFDNQSNLLWNALVNSGNPQCILAGSKPQKLFFLFLDSGYNKSIILKNFCFNIEKSNNKKWNDEFLKDKYWIFQN